VILGVAGFLRIAKPSSSGSGDLRVNSQSEEPSLVADY
jgi:hypothetical protein